MGNEYANQVGRSVAGAAAGNNAANQVGVVGKQSLASLDAAAMPSDIVERVKARAGTKVTGAGGYDYVVTPEGAFRITKAPDEKYKGRVVTQMGYPKAWSDLAASLEQHPLPAPAAPQAPLAPAPAPKSVTPPSPPEPSLLDRAIGGVESGLHDLKDGANALWDRATSWMHSGNDAGGKTPATPATPATPTTPTAVSPAPSKPPVARPQAAAPREGADGDTLGHALSRLTPTEGKDVQYTLDGLPHADKLRLKVLTDLEQKGTISEEEKAEKKALAVKADGTASKLAADIMSGREDVWRFYCSGLSVWSLAAAGVDVGQRIKAPNGEEYKGEEFTEIDVDANDKPVKPGLGVKKKRKVTKTLYVTLKALIDGEPAAVEIMTRAKRENKTTVDYKKTGYLTGENEDGKHLPEAAQGAAFAFEAAGIGEKVEQTVQKPGDFAQCRHSYKEKDGKLLGGGHAWQVAEVTALGSALFGQGKRSPKPTAGNLDGWHENVTFTITHDTDPRLVGVHTVTSAVRIEAQDENVVHDKKADKNKDGGVQLSRAQAVPDTNPLGYQHYQVFYGRLTTSPWKGWNAATKESATAAAASAPAAAPTPAAPTPAAPTAAAPTPAAPTAAAPTPAAPTAAAPTPAAPTPAAPTAAAPTPAARTPAAPTAAAPTAATPAAATPTAASTAAAPTAATPTAAATSTAAPTPAAPTAAAPTPAAPTAAAPTPAAPMAAAPTPAARTPAAPTAAAPTAAATSTAAPTAAATSTAAPTAATPTAAAPTAAPTPATPTPSATALATTTLDAATPAAAATSATVTPEAAPAAPVTAAAATDGAPAATPATNPRGDEPGVPASASSD